MSFVEILIIAFFQVNLVENYREMLKDIKGRCQ